MGVPLRPLLTLIRRCLRPDAGVQFGDTEITMPAILPGHLHGIIGLALARRGLIWYFERNFERRRLPRSGDWTDSRCR